MMEVSGSKGLGPYSSSGRKLRLGIWFKATEQGIVVRTEQGDLTVEAGTSTICHNQKVRCPSLLSLSLSLLIILRHIKPKSLHF